MEGHYTDQQASLSQASATVRYTWEHSHRELLAGFKLLEELERRGHAWSTERIYRVGPVKADGECILVPFHYDTHDTQRWLYRLTNRPVRVLNLAYEQMHPACAREYVIPAGPFAREQLHHLAWGERFKSLLLDAGISEDKIHITGHPRFDLYGHPETLKSRKELAAEYDLDADKPWILFPCNFNFAYVDEDYIARVRQRGYNVTREFAEGFAKARDAFIAMICEVARACPEHELIVRVHPAGYESDALYAKTGADFSQLKTIADYDISHWISQSEAVVVWNSTSSMEAMVAGVPVVSYDTHRFGKRFDYDVNKILPTFTKADEVISLIRSLPNAELTYDWNLFEGWYQYRDGNNAGRIVTAIEKVMETPLGHPKGLSKYVAPNMKRRFKDTFSTFFHSREKRERQPFTQTVLKDAIQTGRYDSLQHVLK